MKSEYRRPENDPANKENDVAQDPEENVPFDVDAPEDWGFTVNEETIRQLSTDPDRLPSGGKYRMKCGKARIFDWSKPGKENYKGLEIRVSVVVGPDGVAEPELGWPSPRLRFRLKHTKPDEKARKTMQIDRQEFAKFVDAVRKGGYFDLDGDATPKDVLEACADGEFWTTVVLDAGVSSVGTAVVYQNFRNFEPAPPIE